MKYLLILLVLASCSTTNINFFEPIAELKVSEYIELSYHDKLLICEGFLIGQSQYVNNEYICHSISATELKKEVERVIKTERPNDYVLVAVFNCAIYNIYQNLMTISMHPQCGHSFITSLGKHLIVW